MNSYLSIACNSVNRPQIHQKIWCGCPWRLVPELYYGYPEPSTIVTWRRIADTLETHYKNSRKLVARILRYTFPRPLGTCCRDTRTTPHALKKTEKIYSEVGGGGKKNAGLFTPFATILSPRTEWGGKLMFTERLLRSVLPLTIWMQKICIWAWRCNRFCSCIYFFSPFRKVVQQTEYANWKYYIETN